MGFSSLILEFLKHNRRISFSGFGSFYLKNIPAQVETDAKIISPPALEIRFDDAESDESDGFVAFLASKKTISTTDAEVEIQNQVNFWKAALQKDQNLELDGLGRFYLNDSELHFNGEKLQDTAPDFYGLEQINLTKIGKSGKSGPNDYQLRTSAYWLLPLILIVSALLYLGIAKPEFIFGARTFFEKPKPIPAKIIKTTVPDSLQLKKTVDSTATDSLKNSVSTSTSLKNKNTRWGK